MSQTSPESDAREAWQWAAVLVLALTLARLFAIFATPLELYPDEAQYWLWSRELDLGYFSKPPMIAWTIWLTTRLGETEPFVRLASPFFHAGTAIALFWTGRRLYGAQAALAACALYILAPGIHLSGMVASTDAPLLFFLSLALLAYVSLQAAEGRRLLWLSAGFGAALGLAFLAKYAAIYFVIGWALHLLASPGARRAWSPAAAALALAAAAIVLGPNLAWNAAHDFATARHTAANANLRIADLFHPAETAEFLVGQAVVFGVISFPVLVGGAAVLAWRRRLAEPDRMLAIFALTPLVVVTVQSLLSRANANWAAPAFLPGAVLVGAWLIRWRARRWLTAAILIHVAMASAMLVWTVKPETAEPVGMANALKRAKGWRDITRAAIARAEEEGGSARLSAIAVDHRFLFNSIAYYGRDYFRSGSAPPLTMWKREAQANNQAEAEAPLTSALGARVLAVAQDPIYRAEMKSDFARVGGREIFTARLDRKNRRPVEIFVGEGFTPRPRPPLRDAPEPIQP